MSRKYEQGLFYPKNPTKYKGDPSRIYFRSSWERKLMEYLDTHPQVIEWASEEFAIPYFDPTVGYARRYFPDFLVKIREAKGVRTVVIEVKPESQTRPPKQRSRKTPKFLAEFQIMTERNLFLGA